MAQESQNHEIILESIDMGLSQIIGDASRVTNSYASKTMALGHFLHALLENSTEFKAMLIELGVSGENLAHAKLMLNRHLANRDRDGNGTDSLHFDAGLWKIFTVMYKESQRYRLRNLTIALFPIAICETENDLLFIFQYLNLVPNNATKVRALTARWLEKHNSHSTYGSKLNPTYREDAADSSGTSDTSEAVETSEPYIQMFTVDLAAKQRDLNAFPVIGRNPEIQRAINTLSCMLQNNLVLIGEPGVGRRAIVQGIAARINNGQVPQLLINKRVLKLDISALKAGASVAGALEDRLKKLLAEMKNAGNVILVLEDVHILAKGSNAQDISISTMLMPALTRGELRCIGITTTSEFNTAFKTNRSVSQLFVPIEVEPASRSETLAILRGLKSKIEAFHGVEINDNALRVAVDLSSRYIQDRNLPEKAISLIDGVAAKLSIAMTTKPELVIAAEQRLSQLTMELEAISDETSEETLEEVRKLKLEITKAENTLAELAQQLEDERLALTSIQDLHRKREQLERQLTTAKDKQDVLAQARIGYKEIPEVDHQIAHVQDFQANKKFQLINASVTEKEVSEQISTLTGIPVSKMLQSEKERLLRMADVIGAEVVGQDQAVQAITRVVQRRRAGINITKSPIGSFLLLGPTGTGKTQITKAVARFMFDSEDSLIRLDMGEYKESHKIATLFGAPPGYVGYEEGGVLSEAVRKRPYSVILLDEVEKAHPDIFNVFLPIMDEGYATDSQGRHIDFTNTLIIMTSNLGANEILKMDGQPDAEIKSFVMEKVRNFFKAELIARMNEIVVFNGLKKEHANRIIQGFLNKLYQGLAEKRIQVKVTDKAIDQLIEIGYSSANGARYLRHAVTTHIEDLLAISVLNDKVQPGGSYIIDYVDENFVVLN